MLNPFIDLLANVIDLYIWVVIAAIILSLLISFKIVNRYHPIVFKLDYALQRLTDPVLGRIRRYLPDLGGIDISPVILILLLNFLNAVLYRYFYNL